MAVLSFGACQRSATAGKGRREERDEKVSFVEISLDETSALEDRESKGGEKSTYSWKHCIKRRQKKGPKAELAFSS